MSERIVNRTAVHEHALRCSKAIRAGKFTRVGEAFLDEVDAEVERMVREIRNKYPVDELVPDPSTSPYVTGLLMEKLRDEFNAAVARIVQRKVRAHPSCGCTLQNTY